MPPLRGGLGISWRRRQVQVTSDIMTADLFPTSSVLDVFKFHLILATQALR